jgi:hypothetical protein
VTSDPTDRELADYIARRLVEMKQAAEPEFVAELIAVHREVWVALFLIDNYIEAVDLDAPPFANPA